MKFNVYDALDFYDWEKLDKLQERRAKKFLKLWVKAKEGDQKAKEDLKKHEVEERELKRRANETGYFWI
ncbi:MAG: hypothetical protein BGO10_02105 [Chlamydia sp. 32-24]|nr:MAG: hypothetical protein BGO10_02105 [Chlamydia sp. 32-24]